MLVTIILTCYKQEKFIEKTILSVINQKYNNRELLIWDDSPDDNCRKIISKFVKKYPKKIYAWHHNPNKWIVGNMQFLIDQRNKKSEYIAFLEWDDCLFPEYLEKKLSIFNKYPDVKLVYNEVTTVNEDSRIISEKSLKKWNAKFCRKWKISYEKLISEPYYSSRSSLMVRSEVFNNYTIFSKNLWYKTLISDIYFYNQIANNENIYGIEEPLLYYRVHWNSTSRSVYNSISLYLDMINYINYLFEQWFINPSIYKKQICKHSLIIALVALKKSFWISTFITLKMLGKECVNFLRYRYISCVNAIKHK